MEFNADNPIVKLCLEGMELEEQDQGEKAKSRFMQAWNRATNDFERFMTAHYIARNQENVSDRLQWLQKSLQSALKTDRNVVDPFLPLLYSLIAKCYEALGESEDAKKNQELADRSSDKPSDKGPFFHGTKANLRVGDLLTAGGSSNYQTELVMNHIYFTALINGAGLAAALAKGEGLERVYLVEPTGGFENDPNVTNNKFPGNPTRSYRSKEPLKIIGEIANWAKISVGERQKWQEKLANNKGKIIN